MKRQLELDLYKGRNGGPRPGAGRPRKHSRGVSHLRREKVTHRTPLHINFKFSVFIRTEKVLKIFERGIESALKFNFQVTHFSIQSNHIHLIAETTNNKSLSSGMRSITSVLAKGIGRGSIQIERYHLHVLKTPTEVRNAIFYVLHNDIRHAGKMNNRFTKRISEGRSWLLISSLKDTASAVSPRFLYP